jgi:hypothetical protein
MSRAINNPVRTIRKGWGYWDLSQYPRGGCIRRLTEDTALAVDTSHAGELYGRLPDGRRICITERAANAAEPLRVKDFLASCNT